MNEAQIYFIRRYGSQTRAALGIGINQGQFSLILNRLREPWPTEREKLMKVLSPYRYQEFFGKSQ